jgi:myo-inositol-1(or 4)-monophosphatase
MSHINIQPMLVALAQRIRKKIYPLLNAELARRVEGVAHSGDVTFQLDVVAEQEVESFLNQQKFKLAYYTEDKGLVKNEPAPEWLLIIDPVDGTRPAASGFETAVVSIAACPCLDNPTFKDISHAVILELKTGNLFYAEAGNGVLLQGNDPLLSINPSCNCELELIRWSFELVGRPVERIIEKLGSLINRSSFKGSVYIFNSSAFAITRLVTGQLDAYLDITGWLVDDGNNNTHLPQNSTHNPVVGLFAYDIAAAYLIAKESQCVISDAWGEPLDNQSLISKDILSCIAASNLELHRILINWLNKND